MLYLIKTESGKLVNRWSIDPEKDFAGLTVIGPALKDESGQIENGDWIDLVGGVPAVNLQRKNEIIAAWNAAADADKRNDQEAREALQKLRDLDPDTLTDIGGIRRYLKDLRRILIRLRV